MADSASPLDGYPIIEAGGEGDCGYRALLMCIELEKPNIAADAKLLANITTSAKTLRLKVAQHLLKR